MANILKRVWHAILGTAQRPSGHAVKSVLDVAYSKYEGPNQKHWKRADSAGPATYANAWDRESARNAARYETANNSYAKGIVTTLANNLVGTGPTLRVTTPDDALNKRVEWAWSKWVYESRFVSKLRTATVAKITDGEIFGQFITNHKLRTSVKLDLKLIETDQVTTPAVIRRPWGLVDGIEFDDVGNPTEYHVLRGHPGDLLISVSAYDRVLENRMCHWFREDRPGQPRGISELAPALDLFAHLRRFMLATVTAAETAANIAAMLESTMPPGTEDADPYALEAMEFFRGMMLGVPAGHKVTQMKAEHPQTTAEMFVGLIIREIARCLCIPYSMAAGDWSKENYSSARLGHLSYRQKTDVDRDDCTREIVEPTFEAFLDEASGIPGLLPDHTPMLAANLEHEWRWDPWEVIDQAVEETARGTRLTNRTSSLQSEVGPEWRQRVEEQVDAEIYRQEYTQRRKQEQNAPSAA